MSDQHAATALTAAAVIAAILVARAAILHHDSRARVSRPDHRCMGSLPNQTPTSPAALSHDASRAVHEAEQHVHRCWQQLRTRTEPPE